MRFTVADEKADVKDEPVCRARLYRPAPGQATVAGIMDAWGRVSIPSRPSTTSSTLLERFDSKLRRHTHVARTVGIWAGCLRLI